MRETLPIGVLTYDAKHRKTYDVLCLLKAKGYLNVKVYAVPYHYEKNFQPLFLHRPEVNMDYPTLQDICYSFDYEILKCTEGIAGVNIEKERYLLMCGGALLSKQFIADHVIINSHPGYIPNVRGLDALKWAILEGQPIGVTTHLLGEEIDAGEIIERRLIPVRYEDTFHSVAYRVYETEIDMLVAAIRKLNQPHEFVNGGNYEVHRRMPHRYELRLMESFEKLKSNVPYE